MSNNTGIISVGFSNFVNFDRVLTVMAPQSLAGRKQMTEAKDAGKVLDLSMGRKVRSVILLDNGVVVLSALNPDTIVGRAQLEEDNSNE